MGGNDLDDSKMPPFTSDPKQPLAEPVGSFPEAASWAGIEDLVGSVYQWIDVFSDDHTSRAVLRGAPRWHPEGSHWYQPLSYGPHEAFPGSWRRQDLCSSRIRCFCSLTVWIVLEELVSDV